MATNLEIALQHQMARADALEAQFRQLQAQVGPAITAQIGEHGPIAGSGPDGSKTEFVRYDVADPMPWVPLRGYTMGLNDRVVTVLNADAGVQRTEPLGFDLPSAVYAITGAVRNTDSSAQPPTGYANSLDTFKLQFQLAQNRQFQTVPVMGSAIVGTAERPRFLGKPAWRFGSGATLNLLITPLTANLEIQITLWTLELYPFAGNLQQAG